jgi:hypothetical protein
MVRFPEMLGSEELVMMNFFRLMSIADALIILMMNVGQIENGFLQVAAMDNNPMESKQEGTDEMWEIQNFQEPVSTKKMKREGNHLGDPLYQRRRKEHMASEWIKQEWVLVGLLTLVTGVVEDVFLELS